MNDIFKDVTGIALAVVGVAILYTLVNPKNKTAEVIKAGTSGFANTLYAAMGGSPAGNVIGGGY